MEPTDNDKMSFTINCKKPTKITFPNPITTETVVDLKNLVAEHYKLTKEFCLLDLGRVMDDSELLSSLPRREFTIYFTKTTL